MCERTVRRHAERRGLTFAKTRPTKTGDTIYLLVANNRIVAASARLDEIAEKVAA